MPDEENTQENRQQPSAGRISSEPNRELDPLASIDVLEQNPREARPDVAGGGADYSLGESAAGHGLTSDYNTQISSAGVAEPDTTRRRRGGGRRPPPNFSITDEIRLDTIDPRLLARERAAEDDLAGYDRASGLMGAEFESRAAAIQQQQAQREYMFAEQERQRVAAAEQEHDRALSDLEAMNQSVMDQRIDPARFYTANRGAGLGAAASVALGVLGQGLNPNLQNTAMVIIDRAIDRDIQAQVTDLANQQRGVQTARNLYGDMLRTFQEEGAAREAVRGMYLAEMERRIEALAAQSRSAAETRSANRLVHALRLQRARSNVAAARSRRTTTYKAFHVGRAAPGSLRGVQESLAVVGANAPLGDAANMAQMQEMGMAPALPPQTEQISSDDIRSTDPATPRDPQQTPPEETSQVVEVTATDGTEITSGSEEPPTETPVATDGEPARLSPRARRANRQLYRNPERTLQQSLPRINGQAPQLVRIVNEAGRTFGAGYPLGSESIDSGRGTRNFYFRPDSQNGQLIAISSNGSQRLIASPSELQRGERLLGRRIQQTVHQRSTTDVERARRQTSIAPLGGGFYLTPAGRQMFNQRERMEFGGNLRNSMSLYRLAARTRQIIQENQGTNFNLFRGTEAGRLASRYLRLMGRMANMAGLGTLQEGERKAIEEMTAIGALSSDWLILPHTHRRALASLQDIMDSARFHINDNPLIQSGHIRRAANARDVNPRDMAYAPPSEENAAVRSEPAEGPGLVDRARDFLTRQYAPQVALDEGEDE